MAFMQVATGGGGDGADRKPIISYNAKAGRLFLLDRVQQPDGQWATNKQDVTMTQPAFAVDFGTLEVGWLYFSPSSAPLMVLAPYGQPMPPRPASPGGVNQDGKPAQFKSGFRVHCVGQSIGGVREMAANSGATIEGLNALHTLDQAAPEAAADMLPLVKLSNVLPVKSGQSENFMPHFELLRWVPRPTDILGPRTVPCPTGGARTAPQAAAAPAAPSRPAGHVEPPAPQPAAPAPAKELADAMPF